MKPDTKILACEVETAAPLKASLEAGEPRTVHYTPSFVDGIGGKSVMAEMWPLVRNLIDDSLVVPLADVAAALNLLLERNRIVAEGAGATPVAAALASRADSTGTHALSARAGANKIVCVVSGGNIDLDKLMQVVAGA